MAGRYYVEAADWLRAVAVSVVETDDWETRARSSGGFAATPLGVQWHHTASSGQHPLNDVTYMIRNAQFRPVGNIYLALNGVAYMLAAGAANTAGKGGPWTMSRGTVPLNSGNTTTWALEVANNGVGQAWPQVQIDAFFKISNELNRRWGNKPTDLFTHSAYAPGRKVDPATAAAVLGPWKPRSINANGSWNVDDVKAEASRRAGIKPPPTTTPPTPTPTPPSPAVPVGLLEGADMAVIAARQTGASTYWFSPNGGASRVGCRNPSHATAVQAIGLIDAKTGKPAAAWGNVAALSASELDAILGPVAK